jgi:hypothetical protein
VNREVSPRESAAWWLRSAIRRTASEAFGGEIVREQVAGLTIDTEALDDPLTGVRAAQVARNVAVAELRRYAEVARGVGRNWDEVAEALGIEESDDGESRAEQAYLLLVEGRPLPEDDSRRSVQGVARWTCATCGQRVRDSGPFGSHPDDVEDGHAAACSRRAAALAAFRARE